LDRIGVILNGCSALNLIAAAVCRVASPTFPEKSLTEKSGGGKKLILSNKAVT
jgi:hypothetical protein